MQHLEKPQYDPYMYYHRNTSPTYRKYLEDCGLTTYDISTTIPQFAWKKRIFGDSFCIVRYDRSDIEPDIEFLKHSVGMKHAFVTWIPYSRTDIPVGWRRLYLSDHFQETGYTVLDDANYKKKWNERARRAQKKFLTSGGTIRAVTSDEFIEGFRTTKVKHWYKSDYISYYKRMIKIDASKVRQWMCYDADGTIVAGLAVHDYGDVSVHLVAFTGKKAYPIQGGTGLIDTWFVDSYAKNIKYLTFDQLRNRHGPSDQKGYTDFKLNFIEYRMSFPQAYFRVF